MFTNNNKYNEVNYKIKQMKKRNKNKNLQNAQCALCYLKKNNSFMMERDTVKPQQLWLGEIHQLS